LSAFGGKATFCLARLVRQYAASRINDLFQYEVWESSPTREDIGTSKESVYYLVDIHHAPPRFPPQEIAMQNLVVWHAERGYLVDFDPFGKQETTWSIDIGKAWVFGSLKDANAAMRWLSGPLQILPSGPSTTRSQLKSNE